MKRDQDTDLKTRIGSAVAPAVALLLLGERAFAVDADDFDEARPVPEPTTMSLIAIGVAGAAVAAGVNKRRKK